MASVAPELEEVQMEIKAVKKALQSSGDHLGISGESLKQYFLQLNEKEILLLSRLQPAQGATVAAAPVGGPATAPPAGPTKAFDKDDLGPVLQQLCDYEAVPAECVKALRALSSLAYSDAKRVGCEERVVPQIVRILSLHPKEESVRNLAMKAVCNMAYDATVCAERLSCHELLSAMLETVSQQPDPANPKAKASESTTKAGEALARIVAAEVEKEEGEGNGTDKATAGQPSTLAKVFNSAFVGEPAWYPSVLRLCAQLVDNEVIEVGFIAERFVSHTTLASPKAGYGWLNLAKACANFEPMPELPAALVEAGALRAAVQVMQRFSDDAEVALAGVEALSLLVGSRVSGLQAFVDAGGVQRIESGMEKHVDHELLQTKSIRALGSGVLWTSDMQKKAGYSVTRSIALTKAAMASHSGGEELQTAAVESLSRYLEKESCKQDVAQGGGEDLVKAAVTRHLGSTKLKKFGRAVLDGLGVDKSWQPASQTNGNGSH